MVNKTLRCFKIHHFIVEKYGYDHVDGGIDLMLFLINADCIDMSPVYHNGRYIMNIRYNR